MCGVGMRSFLFTNFSRARCRMHAALGAFRRTVGAVKRTAFDLIAPPACAYCQKYLQKRVVLCDSCMSRVNPIVSFMVPCTKSVSMSVFAAAAYQEPIRSLIVAKRWSNIAASAQLGELIWDKTYFKYAHADILVPIPLHWSRHAWRGYNQAHEIARVIAHKKGCSVAPLLRRVRRTPFQSTLPATKRSENLKNAFALAAGVDVSQFAGKHIVLVDDLMTTGSTLREAARVLRTLNPASISAVVAARAL